MDAGELKRTSVVKVGCQLDLKQAHGLNETGVMVMRGRFGGHVTSRHLDNK